VQVTSPEHSETDRLHTKLKLGSLKENISHGKPPEKFDCLPENLLLTVVTRKTCGSQITRQEHSIADRLRMLKQNEN
jgi:hypothetical protein